MKFKELFDKFADFIDNNRGNITKLLLSTLAFIALIVVFFISSDEMSISKEVDHLVKNIESRKYQIAYDYYETLKSDFSGSKMSRFNKSASKKINSVIINNGDKYVNGQISKEQYIGLINTVNALDNININIKMNTRKVLKFIDYFFIIYYNVNVNKEKNSKNLKNYQNKFFNFMNIFLRGYIYV